MDFLSSNRVTYGYDSIDEAFPPCDPGTVPVGSRVLFQMRSPKKKTKGGIILTDDVRETDQHNTQVAKVLAIGPNAFRNRNTGAPWPEDDWCRPGDFVRIPKWGGDRWTIRADNGEHDVIVVIFNDLDFTGRIADPLNVVAFL